MLPNLRRFVLFALSLSLLTLPAMAIASSYEVKGSLSEADGIYTQDGMSDGVPMYTKGNWELVRVSPMDTVWYIGDGSGRKFENHQFPIDATDTPPNDGNWRNVGFPPEGPIPGLTVTLVQSEGDEKAVPALDSWGILLLIVLIGAISTRNVWKKRNA